MSNFEKGLVWFRRDLRLSDNSALYYSLSNCVNTTCVFVFDTNILESIYNRKDRRISFIYESLLELRNKLRQLGSELLIFYGDPKNVIPALTRKLKINAVFTNREYEHYSKARDKEVKNKLKDQGIEFYDFKDQVVFEKNEVIRPNTADPYRPYTLYSEYRKSWQKFLLEYHSYRPINSYPIEEYLFPNTTKLAEKEQISNSLDGFPYENVQSIISLGFKSAEDLLIPPGSDNAEKQLKLFIHNSIYSYQEKKKHPGEEVTAELATHIRYGTVSIRQCLRQAYRSLQNASDKVTKKGAQTWIDQIIWREFYSMLLQVFPEIENGPYQKEYDDFPWENNEEYFEKWKNGETGIPIIDAGMRELKATGILHNRARMVVASFLTKNLLIDWKKGEKYFANNLLDYDVASNMGNWQNIAGVGVDSLPYFRILNPQNQVQRFDPDAKYIKKWVPELEPLRPSAIYNMTYEYTPEPYPRPIVDIKESRDKALEVFKGFMSSRQSIMPRN